MRVELWWGWYMSGVVVMDDTVVSSFSKKPPQDRFVLEVLIGMIMSNCSLVEISEPKDSSAAPALPDLAGPPRCRKKFCPLNNRIVRQVGKAKAG